MSTLSTVLLSAFYNVIEFVVGFTIGSLLDLVFFRAYLKVCPTEKENPKLVLLMFVQMYILFLLMHVITKLFHKYHDSVYFVKVGLLASQLFLLKFAMERITYLIYDRKKKISELNPSHQDYLRER
jgi:hypothetical protein